MAGDPPRLDRRPDDLPRHARGGADAHVHGPATVGVRTCAGQPARQDQRPGPQPLPGRGAPRAFLITPQRFRPVQLARLESSARGRPRHGQRAGPRRPARPERPVPGRGARPARAGAGADHDRRRRPGRASRRVGRRASGRSARDLRRARANPRRPHRRAPSRGRRTRELDRRSTSSRAEIESRLAADRRASSPPVRRLRTRGSETGVAARRGRSRSDWRGRRRASSCRPRAAWQSPCQAHRRSFSACGGSALESEPVRAVLVRARPPGRRVLRFFGASESAVAQALADAGGRRRRRRGHDLRPRLRDPRRPLRPAGSGRTGRRPLCRAAAPLRALPLRRGRAGDRGDRARSVPARGPDAGGCRVVHRRDGGGADHLRSRVRATSSPVRLSRTPTLSKHHLLGVSNESARTPRRRFGRGRGRDGVGCQVAARGGRRRCRDRHRRAGRWDAREAGRPRLPPRREP